MKKEGRWEEEEGAIVRIRKTRLAAGKRNSGV
jgi:hypothetical protein